MCFYSISCYFYICLIKQKYKSCIFNKVYFTSEWKFTTWIDMGKAALGEDYS